MCWPFLLPHLHSSYKDSLKLLLLDLRASLQKDIHSALLNIVAEFTALGEWTIHVESKMVEFSVANNKFVDMSNSLEEDATILWLKLPDLEDCSCLNNVSFWENRLLHAPRFNRKFLEVLRCAAFHRLIWCYISHTLCWEFTPFTKIFLDNIFFIYMGLSCEDYYQQRWKKITKRKWLSKT